MIDILLISFLFALLCLDKKHIFQFALSQPLITCSIIGLYFNVPYEAMYFGLIVQLIWLSNLPIGAAKTPEGNISTVIGCMLYVQNLEKFSQFGDFLLLLAFGASVIFSYFASRLESFDRKINIRLFDYNCKSLISNHDYGFGRVIIYSLVVQFLFNYALIFIAVVAGNIILNYVWMYISESFNYLWQYIEIAIIGSGVGMFISIYKEKNMKRIIAALSVVSIILIKVL